jgi:hypothetical protein
LRPVFQTAALKRCATQKLYAALKRRSSTVALAAQNEIKGNVKNKVKGSGRGRPLYTSRI